MGDLLSDGFGHFWHDDALDELVGDRSGVQAVEATVRAACHLVREPALRTISSASSAARPLEAVRGHGGERAR